MPKPYATYTSSLARIGAADSVSVSGERAVAMESLPDPELRRARTVTVTLPKTGARPKIAKVNTYAREELEASVAAENTGLTAARRVIVRPNVHAMGDVILYPAESAYAGPWVIGKVCRRCQEPRELLPCREASDGDRPMRGVSVGCDCNPRLVPRHGCAHPHPTRYATCADCVPVPALDQGAGKIEYMPADGTAGLARRARADSRLFALRAELYLARKSAPAAPAEPIRTVCGLNTRDGHTGGPAGPCPAGPRADGTCPRGVTHFYGPHLA